MGEKWPVKCSLTMLLPRHCRVLLTCLKLRHGPDGFTSPPKEGMQRILRCGVTVRGDVTSVYPALGLIGIPSPWSS
jgi:hypothetical protein